MQANAYVFLLLMICLNIAPCVTGYHRRVEGRIRSGILPQWSRTTSFLRSSDDVCKLSVEGIRNTEVACVYCTESQNCVYITRTESEKPNVCINKANAGEYPSGTQYTDADTCIQDLHPPCKDDDEWCPYKASNGECTSFPDYMLANCKKSCSVCETCADNFLECADLAASGFCGRNQSFSKINCRRSCRVCQPEVCPLRIKDVSSPYHACLQCTGHSNCLYIRNDGGPTPSLCISDEQPGYCPIGMQFKDRSDCVKAIPCPDRLYKHDEYDDCLNCMATAECSLVQWGNYDFKCVAYNERENMLADYIFNSTADCKILFPIP